MAALVTFIGGEECGNVAVNTWEDPLHGYKVDFPINEPVLIDPDTETDAQRAALLRTIIRKARGNRFFVVESDAVASEPSVEGEPRRRGRPPRSTEVEGE